MNLKFEIKFSSKYNELANTRGRISLVAQKETMRFSLFLNGLNQRSWLPHLYGYPAKVLTMGGLVERQIELAVEAFTKEDMELADLVIKQDNQVDALEMAIDMECSQILALRQPTAFDLRLLVTVMKIIHEIEKIGNKAERVAEMAIKLAGGLSSQNKFPHYELEHMAGLVKWILHDALDAFARMNLENVAEITERDDNVAREYENILRQLMTRMMEDPRNIT